jgi:hypothetical protein
MTHFLGRSRFAGTLLAVVAFFGTLLFPARLAADELPQEAFNTFPADTLQVAFTSLEELRSSSAYPQIRERIINRQLRAFQEFVRPMGIDLDKDVDEVMVGWRGEMAGPSGYMGLASGRFQPDLIGKYFDRTNLPVQHYDDASLYAFGSGGDPDDLFFTFINGSTAVFGRLADVKAMLDVRQGSANALNSNSDFVGWEGELEGTGPQWGILNGKSASNLAAMWLAGSGRKDVDFGSMSHSIQALLYRIEWDSGFSAHLVMVCDTPATAKGYSTILTVLQNIAQQNPPAGKSGLPPIFQNIQTHQDGQRLEMDASGPPETLDQILPAGAN